MSHTPDKAQCGKGCGHVTTERNRYFTGKYMTARDFAGEQEYFLDRHRLHNRLLHGWGIICGLRVLHHPRTDQEECRQRWVVVKAGVAIDCCGREIFVAEDTPIEVPVEALPALPDHDVDSHEEEKYEDDEKELSDEELEKRKEEALAHRRAHEDEEREAHKPEEGGAHIEHGNRPSRGLLLCLQYDEEDIEPVPALYAEGQCDPEHHEANRVREVPRFTFKRLDEMQPGCWRLPAGWHGDKPCHDDCDEPIPGHGGGCVEADCPCGGCVPLALLFENDESGEEGDGKAARFIIDLHGRRQLQPPPHYLTHIIGTNWPHGGEVTLHELREHMNGELRIHFDRRILPSRNDDTGTGVNRRTFTVEYGGIQRGLEFLPTRSEADPGLAEDGCTAIYPIAPEFLGGRDNIADSFVYVTLRCDFVIDCHEMPVDGNHLHGRLPTGNGIPGGEFVSWFRVVHEHKNEDEESI